MSKTNKIINAKTPSYIISSYSEYDICDECKEKRCKKCGKPVKRRIYPWPSPYIPRTTQWIQA